MNIKLLDCTLRDGGYYNSWDFSTELINEYLQVMYKLPVNYVEIGFRSLAKNGFKGGTAYTTEKFLDQLILIIKLCHTFKYRKVNYRTFKRVRLKRDYSYIAFNVSFCWNYFIESW